MNLVLLVHNSIAFLHWSWWALFAAFACCREDLVGGSAAVVAGVGIRSGNNSDEEDGLRDGRDGVLMNFGDGCLSREWDLATCKIWWGRTFGSWRKWWDDNAENVLDLLVGEVVVVVGVVNIVRVVGAQV